jgi:uncharacterized protein involved in exopolysaccharide biosynthesis
VSPPAADHPDDFQLVDFALLQHRLMFVVHSVHRQWKVLVSAFLAGLLVTLLVWVALPRTYHVDVELLAKRNTLMPALGNPGRKVPMDADAPTLGAAEAVLRRDNLLALMQKTDLLKRWEETRPKLLKLKDRVANLIDPVAEEDRINAMVGMLEKQIKVSTADATVTISVDWKDAALASQLADTAMQNFLEQRSDVEVSTIAETISILEDHARSLREAIDSAIDDLGKPPDPSSPQAAERTPAPAVVPRRDLTQETLRAEAAEVRLTLDAKRRAIKEMEESRRRRMVDLQTELAQQRAVYADAHPNVVTIEQRIVALEGDSPQLTALRRDEAELMGQAAKLAESRVAGSPERASRVATPQSGVKRKQEADELRREYARTSLRFAMEKYDSLQDRIDGAKIELDTAKAAFKYRYSVIRPPVLPRRPVNPKLPVVFGMGTIASVFLAVLAAALADLRSGRVLENWQVEKVLGVPVLGSLPQPAK